MSWRTNEGVIFSWKRGRIDCSITAEAYRNPEYAEIKKILGARNFDETQRLISEQWRSFKELKMMELGGTLPSWLKPHPPGRSKSLLIPVRFDNYRVGTPSSSGTTASK